MRVEIASSVLYSLLLFEVKKCSKTLYFVPPKEVQKNRLILLTLSQAKVGHLYAKKSRPESLEYNLVKMELF